MKFYIIYHNQSWKLWSNRSYLDHKEINRDVFELKLNNPYSFMGIHECFLDCLEDFPLPGYCDVVESTGEVL